MSFDTFNWSQLAGPRVIAEVAIGAATKVLLMLGSEYLGNANPVNH